MNKMEKYLNFMVLVLLADGKVEERERNLLNSMIDNVGIKDEIVEKYKTKLENISDSLKDIDKQIEEIITDLDVITLSGFVRDAFIMAGADGEVHEKEIEIIFNLLKAAKIPEERFSEIEQWGREEIKHLQKGFALLTVNS